MSSDFRHVIAATRGERFVGVSSAGDRFYVEAQVEHVGVRAGRETVDHRVVRRYHRLSITGSVFGSRSGVRSYCITAGQCEDAFLDIVDSPAGIAREQLTDMLAIWSAWHLNDTNAACMHQDAGAHVVDTRKEVWEEQTSKCPEHYPYGSQWLLNPMPEHALVTMHDIIEALNGQPDMETLEAMTTRDRGKVISR